ncbi:hypothetical protein M422DRAFT_252239, partial [Sphaerobolus stellatus SS14]
MDNISSSSSDSQDPLLSPAEHQTTIATRSQSRRSASPAWSMRRKSKTLYALLLLAIIGVIFAILRLGLLGDSQPEFSPLPPDDSGDLP